MNSYLIDNYCIHNVNQVKKPFRTFVRSDPNNLGQRSDREVLGIKLRLKDIDNEEIMKSREIMKIIRRQSPVTVLSNTSYTPGNGFRGHSYNFFVMPVLDSLPSEKKFDLSANSR